MPCQPTPTTASRPGTSAQRSGTSSATGTNDHPGARSHDAGSGTGSSGWPTWRIVCCRPDGVSTLWKIGPSPSGTSSVSTPAARSVSSSCAPAAPWSAPRPAAVRSPSRAVASAAYVTPPPSRQPRGSSGAMSRQADPTWTTSSVLAGAIGPPAYTADPLKERVDVFFYELHEGDDEVYSDVLVVSESEWEPQEFFELVQRVRHDVQHGYEQDTLAEAIALVLERDYGFIYVSDDRLAAAVNVSKEDADNFLAELDADLDDDDDDDDDEKDGFKDEYRTMLADFDPDLGRPN